MKKLSLTPAAMSLTVIVAVAACSLYSQAYGQSAAVTGSGSATAGNMAAPSWDTENTYWRNHFSSQPYYSKSRDYSTYEPAYRYGMDLHNRYPGKRYEELDAGQLGSGWNQARGNSSLSWNDAQSATRDAYNRMYNNSRVSSGALTGSGTLSTPPLAGPGSMSGSVNSNTTAPVAGSRASGSPVSGAQAGGSGVSGGR